MTERRRRLGQLGERLAAERLAALGYEIIERNYRCREGEIDLVTRYAGRIVFVEVRTRRSEHFGGPEESITARKRAHLIAAAQHYLDEHDSSMSDWRIDAVAIEFTAAGQLDRIDIIENAVTGG